MSLDKREQKETVALLKRSKKHTSRVRVLRRFLPFIGIISVLGILLWSTFETFFEKKIEGIPNKMRNLVTHNKVLNPRMQSTDSRGNPYNIEAESGLQIDSSQAILEKPCSEMVTQQGQKIKLKSDKGYLNQKKQTFDYEDNVCLETSDGYVFETKKAEVDLKKQSVTGKNSVQGTGPMGTLTAQDGFYLDKKSQEIHFKGLTRLVIHPRPLDPKGIS